MADFIESLGDCIHLAANAALRLRNNVDRIDQAISQAAQDINFNPENLQQSSLWIPGAVFYDVLSGLDV